jgi:DMSO/TMAO reductase YedYZ molybdopterin-dependent catalytic subunit
MSRIAFDGQLSVPRTFSFDELRALPAQVTERSMLLGGRAIAGVRVGAILDLVGVKPWARFAIVRSEDGYGGADRCSNVKQVASIGFSEVAADVDHACPHAIARRAGTLVVLPGGQS